MAAFRATLEEVVEADLALHVIDAAAPDRERRISAVRQVLEEVGALEVPLIDVYNKADQLTPDEKRRLREMDPVQSAFQPSPAKGTDDLIEAVASRVELDVRRVTLHFNPDVETDRDRLGRVYRHGRVLEHEVRDGRITIIADIPRRLLGWFDATAG